MRGDVEREQEKLERAKLKWVVAQLGGRMHYAVPRLLHEAGRLERFYTDIHAGEAWAATLRSGPKRLYPAGLLRLLDRTAGRLPPELVTSYPLLGAAYYARRRLAGDAAALDQVYLRVNKAFGANVARDGFGGAGGVYAFNGAALEILRAARERGLLTVVEQTIAPRAVEETLLAEEHKRFPGWEAPHWRGAATSALAEREAEEWRTADAIVCGSAFVRDGIASLGGPVERVVVAHYGVAAGGAPRVAERGKNGALRVLTVGEVGLRKGAGYALHVARALGKTARLRWVGSSRLRPEAHARLASRVELAGAAPRGEIARQYDSADVFFLPSVCEGSATVTYEALVRGLPVVTTTHAGSPVADGVDGFVCPARDVEAMAEKLRWFHEDRALLGRMAAAARSRSQNLSLEAYGERLFAALHAVEAGKGSGGLTGGESASALSTRQIV